MNIAQSSHHPASQNKENGEEETKEEEEYEILPLELIQVDDVTQLKGVTLLLSHLPEAIEFYLCRVVFPEGRAKEKQDKNGFKKLNLFFFFFFFFSYATPINKITSFWL